MGYEITKEEKMRGDSTMQIKVAICDDIITVSEDIKKRLLCVRPEYEVTVYNTGDELINADREYDFIFLDIEMPKIDGMETAEILRKNGNQAFIIFLTSHTECMPDAFKVKAFRFLSKPIEDEKFMEAVVEVEKELLNHRKIPIKLSDGIKLINIKDIFYLEAFGDGTYIYTKNEVLESNETLKYWGERLGTEHFFQTHKSYIIALRYVTQMESKAVTVKAGNAKIPISRRRYKALKETVERYVREQAHHM